MYRRGIFCIGKLCYISQNAEEAHCVDLSDRATIDLPDMKDGRLIACNPGMRIFAVKIWRNTRWH
jgi:hypothetical protein